MDVYPYFVLTAAYFILNFEAEAASSDDKPEYLEIFSKHQTWQGYYVYNNTQNLCSLYISSEHYLTENGVLATLKDWVGAVVEMEGEQDGSKQLELTFTVHVMFAGVGRFPHNFTFHSTLYQKNDEWYMKSDVLVPENGLFGEIILHQSDVPWFVPKPEAWRYFVIIGIPLIVGIGGVAVIVGMFYWAIKKGYIRHVPKSYDSFHNPVQYNTERQDVQI